MRIVCLVENTPGKAGLPCEHGLSFYIETKKHKILMDTGASDLFVKNAEVLDIDLAKVDTVVISHGHYDHGGGLAAFLALNHTAKVYIRATAFDDYYSLNHEPVKYIGLDKALQNHVQIVLIMEDTYRIDESLFLFAGMESENLPSANKALRKGETLEQDDFGHEQCLAVREDGQNVLFSGCAHHGILNIMKRWKQLQGKDPDLVISGFHMAKKNGYDDDDINMIIDTALQLKTYDSRFLTCHCTGKAPYEAMKKIMGNKLDYIHCGDEVILAIKKGNTYMKFHKLFAWGTVFCFAMTMLTGYRRK